MREFELTKTQMEVIAAAANSLPPAWHERFRAAVADQLECCDRKLRDDEVAAAVAATRRAFLDDYDDCA